MDLVEALLFKHSMLQLLATEELFYKHYYNKDNDSVDNNTNNNSYDYTETNNYSCIGNIKADQQCKRNCNYHKPNYTDHHCS